MLFLIRNKKTDEWLSILDDKVRIRRRGHTHAKLSKTDPPRLFTSKRGAEYALRAWLSGVISVRHCELDYNGEEYEDWKVEKDPTRIAEDMEIRECDIALKPIQTPSPTFQLRDRVLVTIPWDSAPWLATISEICIDSDNKFSTTYIIDFDKGGKFYAEASRLKHA